ncbi:prophage tail fiber N-terminal domain-containing protein [Serratia fonticola]|uniref:Prophage tail fiber N-terminal domain-containing protein n=1 Tax=Serratia fonticola TaxID=47917 RepID=A0AAJ2D7C7_SERFO|nr:prophage tail fiber N-terminal domain-containing protein [Serratia fonticola]MDQ9125033.1 prophage tail fiber N-terminal domain-containing protein [Serratia fonticola]
MAIISDVLRGPYGDIQPNVIITMQAKGTTARVLTSNRSSTVTDVDGKYSMTVFPGEYEVTISTLGHVGDIRVLTDSVNGTLNDFLISPPKPDELTPEVVRTVDSMRAESAASAAAAKTSENNAAATLANAVKKGEFGIGGSALPYSGSIDDVTIATGMYLALSASTGTKPPGSPTGHLTVSREGATGTTVNQKWVANNDDTLYIRRFYPGGWSTWKKSWDDGNMPNPIKVGDYGLGGSTPVTYADLTNAGQNMFFRIPANTVGSASAAAQGGIMGGYDSGARWQLSWDQGVSAPVLTTRVRNGSTGAWSPFSTLWHSTNTTVDANGFLKKASPIVKLFGTGDSELNDESQGVTTERISEGVYRVSGVLGFNGDGAWGSAGNGIEIPVDDNKRPLIWVESKVLPDGDIEIRTYHRTYATGPYSARNIEAMDSGEVGKKKQPIFVEMPDGTPIDIPAGRWIDLRVEMPASDETELAPEEETTPELEQPAVTEPAPEITIPEAEQGQEPEQPTMTEPAYREDSNTEQNDESKK